MSKPIQDLADSSNSVDDKTIDNWLKWGEAALWVVGGLVAAKKGLDLAGSIKNVFGSSKPGKGGKGGFSDMGVMPVYVVNMGAGGMGGAMGADITDAMGGNSKGKSKWSKVGSAAKTGAAALFMYPIIESIADAAVGDTDFAKWAKKTTHLERDLFPSIFGENIQDVTVKPSTSKDAATHTDITSYSRALEGSINLKLELSDKRPRLTATRTPAGITVDPDTGIN